MTRGSAQNGDDKTRLRQRIAELEKQLADCEQELHDARYANQEMADTIDRIGDVFFAVDREWRFLYVNPKASALAAASAGEILGKTLWETFPQLLGTVYEEQYRRALDQQIPVHIEEPGVISGRWYETIVYPSERGLSIYGRDITARKDAEDALHKNQEQVEHQLAELKAIYTTTPAGLCYLDRDLRYINVSDQLARWVGLSSAEMIGRTLDELSPEFASQFTAILRHVIETGESLVNQEYRAPLQPEPDRVRDWLVSYHPVKDSSGEVIGINVIVQDITDRKELQREFEEALAILDAIFSLAPIGLGFVGPDLRFRRLNKAMAKINGLSLEDHLHKRPDELPLEIVDLSQIMQIWQQILVTGEPVRGIEVSGETPAAPGVTRYWIEHWYPVRVQGEAIGIGIVVEEITERKLYEQSLQQSEARFRHLADALPQLVWTADPDGNVDYYNQRRHEFLGFTKTASGWEWRPVLHPDDLQPTVDAWQHAVETGNIYQIEHRVCRADGEFVWFLSRAVPIHNADGKIVKWYGTATNIHENKVAASERERLLVALEREQAQLKELTQTLEDRVHKGTEQIRTLAARLTLAEHQERKRVAQILHDHIQQMLYAVQMRIHLIEIDLPSAHAEFLLTHTAEMKRMTNEAINAARTLSVELSPPILENEGLPEAIQWLIQQMKEIHGLRISLAAEGDCRVENKNLRVMLFQVGRELLFNVVKHARVNEATVVLKRSDETISIIVSDQGQGMDLAALPLKGSGFGLASIRERLNLFDGLLHIESAPGQGTRVTITCPL